MAAAVVLLVGAGLTLSNRGADELPSPAQPVAQTPVMAPDPAPGPVLEEDTPQLSNAEESKVVIPAIEAGSWGVHVPHSLTWALEHADPPEGAERFRQIETLDALPDLLRGL